MSPKQKIENNDTKQTVVNLASSQLSESMMAPFGSRLKESVNHIFQKDNFVRGNLIMPSDSNSLFVCLLRPTGFGRSLEVTVGLPITDPSISLGGVAYNNLGSMEAASPACFSYYKPNPNVSAIRASAYNFDIDHREISNYDLFNMHLESYLVLMTDVSRQVEIAMRTQKAFSSYKDLLVGPLGLASSRNGDKGFRIPSGSVRVQFSRKHEWQGVLQGFTTVPSFIQRVFKLMLDLCYEQVNAVKTCSQSEFELWITMQLWRLYNDPGIPPLSIDSMFVNTDALDVFFPVRAVLSQEKEMVRPSFSSWLISNTKKLPHILMAYRYFQHMASLYKEYFKEYGNPVKYVIKFMGSNQFSAGDSLSRALKLGINIPIPGTLPAVWPLPANNNEEGPYQLSPVYKLSDRYTLFDCQGPPIIEYEKSELEEFLHHPVPDRDFWKLDVQSGGQSMGPVPALPERPSQDTFYTQTFGSPGRGTVMDTPEVLHGEEPYIALYFPKRINANKGKAWNMLEDSWRVPMIGANAWPQGNRLLSIYSENDIILGRTKQVI
jgi:hypothetical protein